MCAQYVKPCFEPGWTHCIALQCEKYICYRFSFLKFCTESIMHLLQIITYVIVKKRVGRQKCHHDAVIVATAIGKRHISA